MFNCPRCKEALFRAKTPLGTFWVCRICNGRSATVAMLRKILPDKLINAFWIKVRSEDLPTKHKCPACDKLMTEVPVPGTEKTELLDVCKTCQLVWFDTSEYDALPHKDRKPTVEDKLTPEAREKLARIEVKRISERAEPKSWDIHDPNSTICEVMDLIDLASFLIK